MMVPFLTASSVPITDTPSPLASDAASLARELFAPEVFARDNLPEQPTSSELQRSISHFGECTRGTRDALGRSTSLCMRVIKVVPVQFACFGPPTSSNYTYALCR